MVTEVLEDRARSDLADTRFGDVRWFSTIDSTNRALVEVAQSGAPEGTVFGADHQTAGRGRMGRSWTAPPGSSLLVSVLLRPDLPADRLHLVTAVVALAIADGCLEAAGFRPDLKWPNDLLVGDRKLAGVLAEADVGPAGVAWVVVGFGLNVNWPSPLPEDLAPIAVAANELAGGDVDRCDLLVAILRSLDGWYGRWDDVVAAYRSRCATVGREVRVELAGETFTGTATALTDDGALVVGGRTVAAGDVVHLRPATP
jgi:BirA family biotin operon repressor/biotin-[acetyl-CoA-carboxylase] ligase